MANKRHILDPFDKLQKHLNQLEKDYIHILNRQIAISAFVTIFAAILFLIINYT